MFDEPTTIYVYTVENVKSFNYIEFKKKRIEVNAKS
ncbi:hypothetical protein ACVWXS_003715 [Lysinibacillus sp. TE18511]